MAALGLMLGLARLPSGSGGGLSDDTTLSTFSINDENVGHGQTIQRGNGMTAVNVIAVPTHAGASRTINGDSGTDPVVVNLEVGDNAVTVAVTAEDGVTMFDHVVTVRRLTAGLPEITRINLDTPVGGADFVTAGSGLGVIISDATDRIGFWGNTGTETQPDWSAENVTLYVEVTISAVGTQADSADAFKAACESAGFTCATVMSGIFDATCLNAGARVDAAATIGSVTVQQQGENPT